MAMFSCYDVFAKSFLGGESDAVALSCPINYPPVCSRGWSSSTRPNAGPPSAARAP